VRWHLECLGADGIAGLNHPGCGPFRRRR
jgi:hypothetical protein